MKQLLATLFILFLGFSASAQYYSSNRHYPRQGKYLSYTEHKALRGLGYRTTRAITNPSYKETQAQRETISYVWNPETGRPMRVIAVETPRVYHYSPMASGGVIYILID